MLELLTFLTAEGKPAASLGLQNYDGRTITKRDGTRKIMLFASGKKGFQANGKLDLDGKRYQVSCSVVEIGSNAHTNGKTVEFSAEQIAEMNQQAGRGAALPADE
jgi:hypothetical protein